MNTGTLNLKQKSQEFALGGGVSFNSLAGMQEESLFLHKQVRYEFRSRTENVLRMKIESFKKSCPKKNVTKY